MSKTTVRVVAHVVALPGKQEEVKMILTDLVEPTRREEGCILYELLQNQEDSTDFVFVEEWESETLLNAHFDSPHMNEVDTKLAGLLAVPADIRLYRLLA